MWVGKELPDGFHDLSGSVRPRKEGNPISSYFPLGPDLSLLLSTKNIFLQNYNYYKFKSELCKLLQKNPYLITIIKNNIRSK